MDPDPTRRLPDVAALSAAVRAYLEGSQRRARALLLVAEADALAPKIQAQREEAARLAEAAEAQLLGVRGLDPIEKKRAAWALQDAAAAAERAAALEQVVWEERLQGALQLIKERGVQQLGFAVEVHDHRARGHTGLLGDLPHAGPLKAVLLKTGACCVDDSLAGLGALVGAGHGHSEVNVFIECVQ
jgi:hypothetical protein